MRVITVYAAAAFVILELLSIIIEPLRLPDWTLQFGIVFLCIGFVIAIILSWIFDIHPEGGIVKTEPTTDIQAEPVPSSSKSWKIASYISFVVIVGLILFHILSSSNRSREIANLETSIAVLPFDNMSVDEEYSHMGDAITDEIILELQKIKEFDRVLSRTSTMQYKENRPTIPEIAEKLGVNYIIEGSIQRHKEDVSIRVQLIRAKHEDHVWGDEYDGKWEDIFSIQDEIALEVANELKTALSPEEIRKIEKNPTENLKAYNLYLKGRYFWNKRTAEGFQKGIEYFELAIETDLTYALAYAGVADCYSFLGWHDFLPSKEVYPRARAAAEKALEIDEALSEAHTSLAFVKYLYDWDWLGAEREFMRAIELNPSYATAHQWYAQYLSSRKRHDEAIAEAKRAQELDPLSLSIIHSMGLVFYQRRQYDLAIEQFQKILEMDPNYVAAHWYLAYPYVQKAMYSEAIAELQKAIDLSGKRDPPLVALLGFAYSYSGERDKAKKVIEELLKLSKQRYVAPCYIVFIYMGLGQKDQAFEWLEKAYEERDDWFIGLKASPMFDGLRSDPRFQDLLDRVNFPD